MDILLPAATFLMMVFLAILKLQSYTESQEWKELAEDGAEPAFDEQLRVQPIRPRQLRRLDGLVSKIYVMQNTKMYHQRGRHEAEASTVYTSVAIDINGCSHDIETDREWSRVADNAAELAARLDVPFEDNSYGG